MFSAVLCTTRMESTVFKQEGEEGRGATAAVRAAQQVGTKDGRSIVLKDATLCRLRPDGTEKQRRRSAAGASCWKWFGTTLVLRFDASLFVLHRGCADTWSSAATCTDGRSSSVIVLFSSEASSVLSCIHTTSAGPTSSACCSWSHGAVNLRLTTSATRGLTKHWLRLSVALHLSMLQTHGYSNVTANLF